MFDRFVFSASDFPKLFPPHVLALVLTRHCLFCPVRKCRGLRKKKPRPIDSLQINLWFRHLYNQRDASCQTNGWLVTSFSRAARTLPKIREKERKKKKERRNKAKSYYSRPHQGRARTFADDDMQQQQVSLIFYGSVCTAVVDPVYCLT